jgi:glycosyltransferase involved in cell wall biosynthesis
MKTVSCVIPAYNESQRIAKVLEVVAGHPLILEVLVIDDGSKDVEETAKIVGKYPEIRFIRHEINQGKSKALYTGIINAQGEYLFFLDSDLIGLTKENITDPYQSCYHRKGGNQH